MSSRFKAWRSDIPLVSRQDSPLSLSASSDHPGEDSKSSTVSHNSHEVLTFDAPSASMSKQSFVAAHHVFEVSLKMLQPFNKSLEINMYRIDERSLDILRTRTATAIDAYRREHYFSRDAIPSLDSSNEADDQPWLIDFSDSEGDSSDDSTNKVSRQQAVDAIEKAIKSWTGLGSQVDEVLSHLRIAQQKALAISGSRVVANA